MYIKHPVQCLAHCRCTIIGLLRVVIVVKSNDHGGRACVTNNIAWWTEEGKPIEIASKALIMVQHDATSVFSHFLF